MMRAMLDITALQSENRRLREKLAEAEQTLAAIRGGEVDAIVVSGPDGEQVFTLHGAEQSYRVFLESMQQGAVTLSPDGAIYYCNSRFAEMLRYPLEKVIGSPFLDHVAPADRAAVQQLLHNCQGQIQINLPCHDGASVPAMLAFSCRSVEGMQTLCVVVTDMTEMEERKVLADALGRLRDAQQQLRQQNHDLREARHAAELASKAKDQFLAQLSHELRTPLTPVLMALASIEAEPGLPSEVQDDLQLIRRNISLQTRLIDDLLDLSRIIAGKLPMDSRPVDLNELIPRAVEMCRPDIERNSLRVTLQLDACDAVVDGDPVRLQQILWNVLRNAVKFTPRHGSVTIQSRNVDGQVTVSVADTGIGIARSSLHRIFAAFEQAGSHITRQFGGLGLGLSISHRLAEMHGGTLDADSDGEGRGATFTLRLPVSSRRPARETPSPLAPSPRSAQRSILVLEDHEDTRRILARLLGREHTVKTAGTVAAALKLARAEQFGLVISDLGLPDGSGVDFMKEFRTLSDAPGIALSGYGSEADIQRSQKAGFTRHLVKPVDIQELLRAIAEVAPEPVPVAPHA